MNYAATAVQPVFSGSGDLLALEALTLPLLGGKTTLAEALEEEENMIIRLAYPSQRFEFFLWILTHRKDFEVIISCQLCLTANETCRLGEVGEWKHSSFNVCIPVYINNWSKYPKKRVLLESLYLIKLEGLHILVMRMRN